MGVAFMASTSKCVKERGLTYTFKRHYKYGCCLHGRHFKLYQRAWPDTHLETTLQLYGHSVNPVPPKREYTSYPIPPCTSAIKERLASGTILSKLAAQLPSQLRAPCRGAPRALSRCRQCTSTRRCPSAHYVSAMSARRLDGRGRSGERAGRCGARPPRPRCCPPRPSTPP